VKTECDGFDSHPAAPVTLLQAIALGIVKGINDVKLTEQPAPVQEPVAYVSAAELSVFSTVKEKAMVELWKLRVFDSDVALYTTPPAAAQQAQRKPLMDEQRRKLMSEAWNKWLSRKDDGRLFAWDFSFEVEAAHGIKE
jgi:hypothetical protein